MKRTITALLLIAMLLGTIASCGEKTPAETTQKQTANTDTASTETETEAETELQPDIPEARFWRRDLCLPDLRSLRRHRVQTGSPTTCGSNP